LPLGLAWQDASEGHVTLAVQLALAVHVHDVDLDQPIRRPATDTKIEPAPGTH